MYLKIVLGCAQSCRNDPDFRHHTKSPFHPPYLSTIVTTLTFALPGHIMFDGRNNLEGPICEFIQTTFLCIRF